VYTQHSIPAITQLLEGTIFVYNKYFTIFDCRKCLAQLRRALI
jgi:hypothetical protein